MKKIHVMMIACLSVLSFYSYSQDCADDSNVTFCKVDMSVNSLIADADLSQYKSQDALNVYSQDVCANSFLGLEQDVKTDSIATEICLNKFSIAWMEQTLVLNNEKIKMLAQDIVKNNASLDQMTDVINDKKAQIEQLKK